MVARIYVGALVAVYFYCDEMFVDDAGRGCVFIRLAVHYVAPVAPDRPNIQQDRLVFLCGAIECRLPPLHPAHRLVDCRTQVCRSGAFQPVCPILIHILRIVGLLHVFYRTTQLFHAIPGAPCCTCWCRLNPAVTFTYSKF